ncbi:hypothetical protein WP39_08740 [Streptomyces sp. 604F]|nr:hypothetical protein [Streptomyces sp. 604F]
MYRARSAAGRSSSAARLGVSQWSVVPRSRRQSLSWSGATMACSRLWARASSRRARRWASISVQLASSPVRWAALSAGSGASGAVSRAAASVSRPVRSRRTAAAGSGRWTIPCQPSTAAIPAPASSKWNSPRIRSSSKTTARMPNWLVWASASGPSARRKPGPSKVPACSSPRKRYASMSEYASASPVVQEP